MIVMLDPEGDRKERTLTIIECDICGKLFGSDVCPCCAHLSPPERRHLELLYEIRDLLRRSLEKK